MGKTTGIDVVIDKYGIKKFVNKEKGTVTLKLDPDYLGTLKIHKEVCDQLRINKALRHLIIRSPYLDFVQNRFIATAKCGPKDEFNERVGTSIAFRKLKGKIRKNVINSLLDIFYDCSDAIENLYDLYTVDKLQDDKDISEKNVIRLFKIMKKDIIGFGDEEDYYDE